MGAGMAGCSLARTMADAGVEVHLIEMGQGPGGRMATRKTRDVPGLAVNHGAPLFRAEDPAFRALLQPLLDKVF